MLSIDGPFTRGAARRLATILLPVVLLGADPAAAAYPERPVVVIVHTKPGGAMDLTARMVAQIARDHFPAPLVVENRYGGSGTVAMRAVRSQPADGHTLLAFPATFISALQITRAGVDLDDFRFVTCLAEAPEAVITRRDGDLATIADIVADARRRPGEQLWIGPGIGSLDHLMAVKTWEALGIDAVWVPYDGGGSAMAALLGGHGDVYVGNPEDVRGRPGLRLAAVSAPARLASLPDVPTLPECGADLAGETMWRGFAVRAGTPDSVVTRLERLLADVATDPRWLEFVTRNSAEPLQETGAVFADRVAREERAARRALRLAGIMPGEGERGRWLLAAISLPVTLLLVAAGLRARRRRWNGPAAVGAAGLALAVGAFIVALGFPPPADSRGVGPAAAPLLWTVLLALVSLAQVAAGVAEGAGKPGRPGVVLAMIALVTGYVALMPVAGFFPATLLGAAGGMALLGYRDPRRLALVGGGTLLFCWIVFVRILGLPLPAGLLG